MNILQRFTSMPAGGIDPACSLVIGPAALPDYLALAMFHYLPARPATIVRIMAAWEPAGTGPEHIPVGILVVSMPPLNAPWRARAWPRLFSPGDKTQAARRANALVRTISRVVVDPRWRGLGVARRLVGAYLDTPLTPCTETLAAMGPVCRCFSAAGMREIPLPPARHDQRLLKALGRAGLEPWQLLDPALLPRLDIRALRSWARASRAHRSAADGCPLALARRAARALSSPRVASVHGPVLHPAP